jgi:hypothetical protein
MLSIQVDSVKLDLEEEFDPETHDAQMSALYDEHYYQEEMDDRHVRWRMLAYADVCCRMLTYAAVSAVCRPLLPGGDG